MKLNGGRFFLLIVMVLSGIVPGALSDVSVRPVEVFKLPPNYIKPSAMVVGAKGNIYLTLRSSVLGEETSKIVRISPEGLMFDVHTFSGVGAKELPVLATGITMGPDGHLYVADTMPLVKPAWKKSSKRKKSSTSKSDKVQNRVVRVNMENGNPAGNDVMVMLTKVRDLVASENFLYFGGIRTGNSESGVIGMEVSDLPLQEMPERLNRRGLTGDGALQSKDMDYLFKLPQGNDADIGCYGLGLDSKRNLYVAVFEAAQIWKLTLSESGAVVAQSLWIDGKQHGLQSLAGLSVDHEDNVWATDPLGNALVWIDSDTANVKIVAKNTGEEGNDLLAHPIDCVRRGNKVFVANQETPDAGESHFIPVFEVQ